MRQPPAPECLCSLIRASGFHIEFTYVPCWCWWFSNRISSSSSSGNCCICIVSGSALAVVLKIIIVYKEIRLSWILLAVWVIVKIVAGVVGMTAAEVVEE